MAAIVAAKDNSIVTIHTTRKPLTKVAPELKRAFISAATENRGYDGNQKEQEEDRKTNARTDPKRRKNPKPAPSDHMTQLETDEEKCEQPGKSNTTRRRRR